MHDKLKEASAPHADDDSSNKQTLHAAIGHFTSLADAQNAVKALKRAGFAGDAISVRQIRPEDQDSVKRQAAETPITIVGVQAEGERAAEAWSILHNSQA